MEKKTSLHNAPVVTTTTGIELDAIPKHQHNTPPQYLRYVQQSLKIPNNQRQSPMIHQHMHQPYQPQVHKIPYNTSPNIHSNPLHLHYNNQYIYQQAKLKQHQQQFQNNQQMSPTSPIYQTQQQAYAHSVHVQNSPQPWVPQPQPQSTHIYQSQPQPKSEPLTPTTSTSSTATPVHNNKHREIERRRSGNQQLRSPSVKRPSDAPVTLQGWLHKQGSDGLMLWKKRWFVLSEYVLYYYKGPEEEKLLGSILLPSYKVSICGPEDKANRKYAFKCEHTNMRTYILAGDSHESMMQWARVLNLASLLQSNNEPDSLATTPSTYNMQNDNEIYTQSKNQTNQQNQHQNYNQTQQLNHQHQQPIMRMPLHAHSSSNTTDFSNPSQDTSQYNQPLYANAPPKPRRLNDTGYSSPSPEMLDRYNEPKYVTLQPPPYMRNNMANMSKSNSVYSNQEYNQDYSPQQPQHPQHYVIQNVERRTPDTYGRSKHMNGSHPSDYEDIYSEQFMYKRPLSPLAYNKSVTTPVQRSYTPASISREREKELLQVRKSPNSIPRPHSADFLEYEATHRLNNVINVNPQPARPKSSLDINRNGDHYFYSEERYAEKMRKSAQYLGKYTTPIRRQQPVEMVQDNVSTFPLMRSSTQPFGYATTPTEYSSMRRETTQPTRCRSVLSEGSISKELDAELYGSQSYKDHQDPYRYDHLNGRDVGPYDPFTRSASARLANIEQRLQGDGRASMNKEGERKREESMKRLLEWKQRMLQSPLNRKVNQNVNNKAYNKPEYYKRNNSYARHADQRLGMGNQYNSYSSDDEENADGSAKENKTMQAGRTLDTLSSETSAPYTSISMLVPSQTDTISGTQHGAIVTTCTTHKNDHEHTVHSRAKAFTSPCNSNDSDRATPTNNYAPNGGGALVKSILADFTKSPESPRTPNAKDIETIIEENYMIMTPKKNAFEFGGLNDVEENPYVEMTQGLTPSILEPYEMVTFGEGNVEGHMEPLYMELHHTKGVKIIDGDDNKEKKTELPDILLPHNGQHNKSDSSDADDEASKDLESLYSTKRFSLSDVFRPASYYLGASQNALPEQDSSDSELVSPPPIPRSPPPMEEFSPSSKHSEKDKPLNDKDSLSICSTQTDELGVTRFSQNSDSDAEYIRKDRLFKRRPVSIEFRDEVESLDSEFNSTDIKTYLQKIDSDINQYHDYENMIVTSITSPILHSRELSKDSAATTTYMSETSEILEENNLLDESRIFLDDKSNVNDVNFASDNKLDKKYDYSMSSAPYYYSDLGLNTNALYGGGMLKLNNQRGTNNGGKRDITHIVNPIRCNNLQPSRQQSAINLNSCEFTLGQYKMANETRSASVDFLNLTDKSGHIDKKNVYESDTLKRLKVPEDNFQNPEMRNVYPVKKDDKFISNSQEGQGSESGVRRTHSLEGLLENVLSDNITEPMNIENTEGSYLWEEDAIWRETLRNASQRHTKSLDDLDCVGITSPKSKKTPRAITRDVVYVNDTVYNNTVQPKYTCPKQDELNINTTATSSSSNSTSTPKKTISKRDKENFIIDREKLRQWDLLSSAPSDSQEVCSRANTEIDFSGDRNRTSAPVAQDAASGSMSMTMRETFLHNMATQRTYNPINHPNQSRSTSNLHRSYDSEYGIWQDYYLSRAPSQQNIEIENRKAQIHLMDAAKRMENLQKLEQIKQHLLDLEKQYEKGKPMVNLVDNMVKLGSLYRFPTDRSSSYTTRDRIEFNQQMQEKKLLDDERRDWNRINSNHIQLQQKVQQLYELDQLIQEGSGTLQGLQQDKEEIERALGGIRNRLMQGYNDPELIEKAKKQQSILENELSRVHLMLAQNSKKLEETVAGNARLEQELLVLKQKLQISKNNRASPQFSNPGDSLTCGLGNNTMLESDLQKMQQKVGDLQKQRQELSMQVRQLTDRANNIPVKPFSPTQDGKNKRFQSQWRETDLDTMNIFDHGDHWESTSSIPSSIPSIPSSQPSMYGSTTPLYIKTDLKYNPDEGIYSRSTQETSTDDSSLQHNSSHQEKQEIKTVRIVKRESERRHRDREKVTTNKYDALLEDDYYTPSPVRPTSLCVGSKALSNTNLSYTEDNLSRTSSTPSISQYEKDSSPVLSPVFKSEAARAIITEIQETPKQTNRRAVPKEKRRHYTAPNNNLIRKSFNQLPTTDDDTFNKAILETRRARDDLDMERALRQRIDAPDVVRSTLSNKELKYNENTIDNILGTPNKIFIPERYIPEQTPQLSAEEEEQRLRKVESIKKMLSDSAILSTSTANLANGDEAESSTSNTISTKATTKMIEEKKQREHLLQLNQILAKQVMEMSKIVAVKAQSKLDLESEQENEDDDDLSPITPLPLYQQRDNFYS